MPIEARLYGDFINLRIYQVISLSKELVEMILLYVVLFCMILVSSLSVP
jgi:hypothetical protein